MLLRKMSDVSAFATAKIRNAVARASGGRVRLAVPTLLALLFALAACRGFYFGH
jgi:hypothetical protein